MRKAIREKPPSMRRAHGQEKPKNRWRAHGRPAKGGGVRTDAWSQHRWQAACGRVEAPPHLQCPWMGGHRKPKSLEDPRAARLGVREGPRALRKSQSRWRAHGRSLAGAHGRPAWGYGRAHGQTFQLAEGPRSGYAEGPRASFGGGPRAARLGVREGPRADLFGRRRVCGWDVRKAWGWSLMGVLQAVCWGERVSREGGVFLFFPLVQVLKSPLKSAEGPRASFAGGPRAARLRVREGPRADLPAGGGPTVGVRGGPTGVLRRGPTGGPLGSTGGPTGGFFWDVRRAHGWVLLGAHGELAWGGMEGSRTCRKREVGCDGDHIFSKIAQVSGGPTGGLWRGPTGGPLGGTGGPTGRPSSWRRAHGRGTRRAHGRPSPGAHGRPAWECGRAHGRIFFGRRRVCGWDVRKAWGWSLTGACRWSAGEHRSAERGSFFFFFFFFLVANRAQVCGGPTGVLRRGPTGGPLEGTGGPTGRPSSWRRAHGRGTRRAHGRPSPEAHGRPAWGYGRAHGRIFFGVGGM